jgi:hypothetical protein
VSVEGPAGPSFFPPTIVHAMAKLEPAPWWTVRRAQNRKPATYRCPFCGGYLPSMSEHVLIAPEGDMSRRRHAHTACAAAARQAGRLPSRDEWVRTQPRRPGLLRRLFGGAGPGSGPEGS